MSFTIPDGEYEIDITALLSSSAQEENFGLRFGFVPESMETNLPYHLVRNTIVQSNSEDSYILQAESTGASSSSSIFFEGSMNKSSSSNASQEYLLIYDEITKNFKMEKLNGMIRMNKSRNGATLEAQLNKLKDINKHRVEEDKKALSAIARQRQQSIRAQLHPKIPQDIPHPSRVPSPSTIPSEKKITATSSRVDKSKKISVKKIKSQLKAKTKSSPLVQSYTHKKTPSEQIDEISLDMNTNGHSNSNKTKLAQPTPISGYASAAKRLPNVESPSTQPNTPEILSQTNSEPVATVEMDDDDSDLGSLAGELEAELDADYDKKTAKNGDDNNNNNNDHKHTKNKEAEEEDWGIDTMDWDMEEDFEFVDDATTTGTDSVNAGQGLNIIIQDSSTSHEKKPPNILTPSEIDKKEKTGSSGPISMREFARSRGYSSSPVDIAQTGARATAAPTPVMASSSKLGPATNNITTGARYLPTPKLNDSPLFKAEAKLAKNSASYEDEEDVSEEE